MTVMSPPPTHSLWERLNNSALLRFLLLFASGWALVQLLAYFEIVVVVFVSATIFSFLLSHPVQWCRRFIPHGLAVFFIFGLSLLLISGLVITVSLAVLSQGPQLILNIGDSLNELIPLIGQAEDTLRQWGVQVDLQTLGEEFKEQALTLVGAGFGLLQALLSNFIIAILIAIVTFFMLLDGARIWNFALKHLPPHRRRRLNLTIQKTLLGFFLGRLLLSSFFATSTFLVFLTLKIPYALTLGVIAGLFDLIPGIGATLGISLISLLLLSQGTGVAVQAGLICVVLQQIEENILMPRVMRDSVNINPVIIFFALIVGARIAGLLGIFLSIPVAAVVVSLLEIEEMQGRSQLKKIQPSEVE